MTLNHLEAETVLWKKIEAELTKTLQTLREKNDGDLDAAKTSEVRGQIRQIKIMLGWAKPNPIITGDL